GGGPWQNARVLSGGGGGGAARSELTFTAGDRLAFYLVIGTTTDVFKARNPDNSQATRPLAFFSADTANPDNFDHVRTQGLGDRGQRFAWEDMLGGGDQDFNDVIATAEALSQRATPVPGQAGQTVPATFRWLRRDADFDNELGLFLVDDASGRLGTLSPGDPGYARAALTSASRRVIFASG